MRDTNRQTADERIRSGRQAVRLRKRNVVRAGLGIVIVLLVFSTTRAYRIQESLSDETLEIYHRHVKQDDLLWSLRRTLWLGSNSARDFLINPHANRTERYIAQLADLRRTSVQLRNDLAAASQASLPPQMWHSIEDFWEALESIPVSTANLDPAQRYNFIHTEIVARRNTVGDLVRQFSQLGQHALQTSEAALAQSRREGASRLLWVLGLSVIVAVAVAGFSLAHSESLERQTMRQYEEVERARTELQQFAARLMQIQEEERTRLSRDLHDEIGQALATLRLEVCRAESFLPHEAAEVRQRLASARELAERTVQTVRDISALLRPSLLDDLGLQPAIEWQVEDFTRRTAVPCDLQHEGLREALPDEVRTCVYRVIQESLHNCEKYAAASRVTVKIAQSEELLTVTVQDDGKGFDVDDRGSASRSGGFGILGMHERAATLGGSLEIDSKPEAGTRIRLNLPLNPPPAIEAGQMPVELRA